MIQIKLDSVYKKDKIQKQIKEEKEVFTNPKYNVKDRTEIMMR